MEKFLVASGRLCYNRKDKFVSLYVANARQESVAFEVRGRGRNKEFWIEARDKDAESTVLYQFIYPETEAWDEFKPFWEQFFSEEEIAVLEAI